MDLKSARDLRLNEWEHQAMFATQGVLALGRVNIDMHSLGMCLASRVAQHAKAPVSSYVGRLFMREFGIRSLYYPGLRQDGSIDLRHFGWNADAKFCAAALQNFLEGHDPWTMTDRTFYLLAS